MADKPAAKPDDALEKDPEAVAEDNAPETEDSTASSVDESPTDGSSEDATPSETTDQKPEPASSEPEPANALASSPPAPDDDTEDPSKSETQRDGPIDVDFEPLPDSNADDPGVGPFWKRFAFSPENIALAGAAGVLLFGLLGFAVFGLGGGGENEPTPVSQEFSAPPDLTPQIEALRTQLESMTTRQIALEAQIAAAPDAPETEELRQHISSLEAEVAELRAARSTAAPGANDRDAQAAAIAALREELNAAGASERAQWAERQDALEARLDALASVETRLERALSEQDATLAEQVSSLATRTQRLEAADAAEREQQMILAVALAHLADNALNGRPFQAWLDQVERLSPPDEAIVKLRPYAAAGIDTATRLAATFPSAADAALLAAEPSDDAGLMDRMRNNFGGLVSVRRVGEIEGDAPDAIIARAGAHIREGDLESAAEEVGGLEGPSAEAMSDWLGAVEARLAVSTLIAALSARILETPDD